MVRKADSDGCSGQVRWGHSHAPLAAAPQPPVQGPTQDPGHPLDPVLGHGRHEVPVLQVAAYPKDLRVKAQERKGGGLPCTGSGRTDRIIPSNGSAH